MADPSYHIEEALDRCLARLRAGETVEACLRDFPDHAAELEPLLAAYIELRRWQPPALSPQARSTIRNRAVLVLPEPQRRGAALWSWSNWGLRLGAAALLVIALFGGGVAFAGDSLPGQPLYPLKRAGEAVQRSFTSGDVDLVSLQLALAQHRIDEISGLARSRQPIDATLIAELRQHYRAAAEAIVAASPSQRPGLLMSYSDTVAAQQRALNELLGEQLSLDNRQLVGEAAAASAAADQVLTAAEPTPSPSATAVPTAVPTAAAPAEEQAPTATATATERPTATVTDQPPSPTSTAAPTAEPTEEPTEEPTARPTARPRPTATPLPSEPPAAEPTEGAPAATEPPAAEPTEGGDDGSHGTFVTPTSEPDVSPTAGSGDDGSGDGGHDHDSPPPTSTRPTTPPPGATAAPRPTDDDGHEHNETKTPEVSPTVPPHSNETTTTKPTSSAEPEDPTHSSEHETETPELRTKTPEP